MANLRGSQPASMLLVAVMAMALVCAPARAATLLRDAGIEDALSHLAAPVLRAAGLSPHRVRVLVVDDRSLNAFVLDRKSIFLHAGLIEKAATPEMIQAVIAHEAAHIANGHLARRLANLRNARSVAGFGVALAVLAAAGGGGRAAAGIAAGTSSAALRYFLSHSRAEESSADRSAIDYLRRAGVDPSGMVALHRLFRGQELLSAGRQDPYMRSHPLTRDRIRVAKGLIAGAPKPPDDPQSAYWFARARGLLSAWKRAPKWTQQRLKSERYADLRLLREAISRHRQSDLNGALRAIDKAIALRPQDAFFRDAKGQILLESRRFAAAQSSYAAAARIAPNAPLILAGLGRAQLAAGRPRAAISTLEKSRALDFRNPAALRDLGAAYAQDGQHGMAALSAAERYALIGRLHDAGILANRASGLLARGSPPWRRAQDVLIAAQRDVKRREK